MKTYLKVYSFKQLVDKFKDAEHPIGDLCTDILRDKDNFDFNDDEKCWLRLKSLTKKHIYIKYAVESLYKIYELFNYYTIITDPENYDEKQKIYGM